jgi:hypothetical protein
VTKREQGTGKGNTNQFDTRRWKHLIPSAARDLLIVPWRQGNEARSLVALLLGMRWYE